jgi:transglutaminase-like putative cysteine protease
MEFEITHITDYKYGHPAAEAYAEARLTPPQTAAQKVIRQELEVDPATKTSAYEDHFGNVVHFFSLPYRHKRLSITNRVTVQTQSVPLPVRSLEASIHEWRQIFTSALPDVFDYLQPTETVETGKDAIQWARRYLRGDISLGEGLQQLNEAIHDSFEYRKGATENMASARISHMSA